MSALEIAADLVSVVTATTPPTPAADPNTMYTKDWLTIAVGIVAGLGGALIAGFAQAWKTKHDQRVAREAALWEYHRVLTDISADMSAFMGDTVEGYDEGPFKARIAKARAAAYPYFHLFPPHEIMKLRYPTSNPGFTQAVHEEQEEIEAAIDVLDGYLVRRKKRRKRE